MCRSVRQTPHALTRRRTWAAPGSGSPGPTASSPPDWWASPIARTDASSTLGAMAAKTDDFDLGRLRLAPGEGRRLDPSVPLGEFAYGGESYAPSPAHADAVVDVARMTGGGYSLPLRFAAALAGPCMRCLEPAS